MTTDRRSRRVRRWFVERALFVSVSLLAVVIAAATTAFAVAGNRQQTTLIQRFLHSEANARAQSFTNFIEKMLDNGVLQTNIADPYKTLHAEKDALQFARFGVPHWDAFQLFSESRACGAEATGWWVAHYFASDAADPRAGREFGSSLFLTIALPTCTIDPYRRSPDSGRPLDGVDHFVVSAAVGQQRTQWHGVIEAGPQGFQPELWLIRSGVEPATWLSWRTVAKRRGIAAPSVSTLAGTEPDAARPRQGLLVRLELPLAVLVDDDSQATVEDRLNQGVDIALTVTFDEASSGRSTRELPPRPVGLAQQNAFAERVSSYANSALDSRDRLGVMVGGCDRIDASDLESTSVLYVKNETSRAGSTLFGPQTCKPLRQHGIALWVQPALGSTDDLPSSKALWFCTVVIGSIGFFYAAVYGLVIQRLRRITRLLRDKQEGIVNHYTGDRPPRDEIDLLARAAAEGSRARKREIEDAQRQADLARRDAEESQARTADRVMVTLGLKHVIGNDLAQLGRFFERSKEAQADEVVQGIMRWVEAFANAETAYDFVGRGSGGLSVQSVEQLLGSVRIPDAVARQVSVPLETQVVADPFLAGAAVGQLIENATRETKGDARRIAVRAQWAEDGRVDLLVQNEGRLRLDPEMIFDLSVSDSDRSKLGRRGLGLYLVREIMTRMGGTAHAKQVEGMVVFTLRFHTAQTGAEVLARDEARRRVRDEGNTT